MLILSIAAFGFIVSQFSSEKMNSDATSRYAAIMAAQQAAQPLMAAAAAAAQASAVAAVATFPRAIASPENGKTYCVFICRIEDAQGGIVINPTTAANYCVPTATSTAGLPAACQNTPQPAAVKNIAVPAMPALPASAATLTITLAAGYAEAGSPKVVQMVNPVYVVGY